MQEWGLPSSTALSNFRVGVPKGAIWGPGHPTTCGAFCVRKEMLLPHWVGMSPTSLFLPAAPQRQRTCQDLKSLVALGGDTDRPRVQAMTWVCSCLKRMEESLLPG